MLVKTFSEYADRLMGIIRIFMAVKNFTYFEAIGIRITGAKTWYNMSAPRYQLCSKQVT